MDETVQKKTERLHMLISPEELEAIEAWRYKNRAGTRAEAVRRLVQIGLGYDSGAESLMKRSERALKALLRTFDKISLADRERIPKGIRGGLAVAIEEQLIAYRTAVAAYVAAATFHQVNDRDVGELMQEAEALINELRPKDQRL